MPKQQQIDPYAPPPLKKGKTGPLIRGVIIAGLLVVGGAVAYTVMQTPSPPSSALEQQGADNQKLADGSYAVRTPQAAPPEATPEAAPAPRVTTPRRSAAPRESAPPVKDVAPVQEAPSASGQ